MVIGLLGWLKKRMLLFRWLKNLAFPVKNGKQDIDIEPMPGPDFSLKKRKLEDALSSINASNAHLAEKRRACDGPLREIAGNLAALPVSVFICNI